jgi:hypothetical protein
MANGRHGGPGDEHGDGLDMWLNGRVDPLPPPDGTFDLIKRRARRRKYRKLGLGAAAAAVIVAAAVAVPQVVRLPSSSPVAAAPAGQSSTSAQASSSSAGAGAPASASSAPASLPAGGPVPADFQPTSVTFVGTETGYVIGQAGTAGDCATQYCTSVARTQDAGKTWVGLPAPGTGAPDGATGVSQIRFLNTLDGWAFGPELWVTHDGGESWTKVDTGGLRVTDLETVDDEAFALFASCHGTGTRFASGCTSYSLYSSPAGSSDWTQVGAATSGLTNGANSESASLVLTGSRGFLLAPGGQVYAGPVTGGAGWTLVNSISKSCVVGPPQLSGQPSGVLLGAVTASELILACLSPMSYGDPVVSTQTKQVYSSPNGGASWIQMASAPNPAAAVSVAASPSETLVLATSAGLEVLPHGDIAWQSAKLTGGGPAGGFSYAGMTTDLQGIALPANPDGTVWFTFDGGLTWAPSDLNS